MDFFTEEIGPKVSSARLEMGSYEAFWSEQNYLSFKKFNQYLLDNSIASFTDLASEEKAVKALEEIERISEKKRIKINFQLSNSTNFPCGLSDAKDPIKCFYFSGDLNLLFGKSVSIVGSRKASEDGKKRARRLAKLLVKEGYTIISGLAEGIDTSAHTAAIEAGGQTVGVIGTSITENYPASNRGLQKVISDNFLLLSQVPILYYRKNTPATNRFFFPERNKTMSALSLATIIVEASETSGTLIQARAAMEQKRKLFILNNCFEKGLKWPEKFLTNPEYSGRVFRVREIDDILKNLED